MIASHRIVCVCVSKYKTQREKRGERGTGREGGRVRGSVSACERERDREQAREREETEETEETEEGVRGGRQRRQRRETEETEEGGREGGREGENIRSLVVSQYIVGRGGGKRATERNGVCVYVYTRTNHTHTHIHTSHTYTHTLHGMSTTHVHLGLEKLRSEPVHSRKRHAPDRCLLRLRKKRITPRNFVSYIYTITPTMHPFLAYSAVERI